MTSAEREAARAERKAEKEEKRYDSGRRRLASVTVLFDDHTYLTQVVDIDRTRKVSVNGVDYVIPDAPYRNFGLWPHKARSLKRAIFKDEYFNIDFREGDPKAINVPDEHDKNTNYWDPTTWLGALDENLYRDSIRSQARADRNSLFDNKAFVLVLFAIIGIGGVIAAHMFGMF